MPGALADLNQQNNKTSYDINQVKNQVKDQVKEALIENKKKRRGGKKKKEKKNHESGNDQSNTKTSSFKDVQNHNTSLNQNRSSAGTITGYGAQHEESKHSGTSITKEIKFDETSEMIHESKEEVDESMTQESAILDSDLNSILDKTGKSHNLENI